MSIEIIGSGKVEFASQSREYDIANKNIVGPVPRYFIGYNSGRPFISEEVPKEFREPMIIHELAEFEIYRGLPDSCLLALGSELRRVPQERMSEYIPFRIEAFKSLIDFLIKYDEHSSFIPLASKSLTRLEELSLTLRRN